MRIGGAGEPLIQSAVARRTLVPPPTSPRRSPKSARRNPCLIMLENEGAQYAAIFLDRLGGAPRPSRRDPARRCSSATTCRLPRDPSSRWWQSSPKTLAGFADIARLGPPAARSRVTKEACEKATVTPSRPISADHELGALIRTPARERPAHRGPGAARAAVRQCAPVRRDAVRALGMPLSAVCGLIYARNGTGLRAVLPTRPGFRHSIYPAFREAFEAMREGGFVSNMEPSAAQAAHGRARADPLRRPNSAERDRAAPARAPAPFRR